MTRTISTYSTPQLNSLVHQTVKDAVKPFPKDDVASLFTTEKADATERKAGKKAFLEIDKERVAGNKYENQRTIVKGMDEGYSKEIKKVTAGISRNVTEDQWDNLQIAGFTKHVSGLVDDISEKVFRDMRNLFGYGTTSGFTTTEGQFMDTTTGDSTPIFFNAKTLKNSAKTYSTLITGNPKITEGGLLQAERQFRNNVMDNYGQVIAVDPDTIITTNDPAIVKKVTRLLNSISPMYVNDTAGTGVGTVNGNANVKNVNRNRYMHKIVDFDVDIYGDRDDSKSFWWALAHMKTEAGRPDWKFVHFKELQVFPPIVDNDRGNKKFVARKHYGLGAVDSKTILLSKATSA